MEITQPGWAVVITKPAAEFAAKDALRRRGYRIVLPVYRKFLRSRREPGGVVLVMRPLFQGYLFVELHPGQAWIGILHTPGVSDMVRRTGNRDVPALLEPELIATLYVDSQLGVFDEQRPTEPVSVVSSEAFRSGEATVKPGDPVRVAEGPFQSFRAKLQDIDERGRAQTLLSLFNREVSAEFSVKALAVGAAEDLVAV
jgi:transcription antitermination factor NusG